MSRPPSDRAFSPRFPLGYMHGFAGKFARTCRGGREDTPSVSGCVNMLENWPFENAGCALGHRRYENAEWQDE